MKSVHNFEVSCPKKTPRNHPRGLILENGILSGYQFSPESSEIIAKEFGLSSTLVDVPTFLYELFQHQAPFLSIGPVMAVLYANTRSFSMQLEEGKIYWVPEHGLDSALRLVALDNSNLLQENKEILKVAKGITLASLLPDLNPALTWQITYVSKQG